MVTQQSTPMADDAAVARTIEALKARGMDAMVAETHEEALEKLSSLVPDGSEVFAVTSETLDAIGFTQLVTVGNRYRSVGALIGAAKTPEERSELQRTVGTTPEYVVGSVQAVAETGEVVVASASGSQMGSYTFGAKRVIWVVGTQKIVPTLEDAMARTRGYTFKRHQEWSPSQGHGPSVMGMITTFEESRRPGRITVLFVKDDLGW